MGIFKLRLLNCSGLCIDIKFIYQVVVKSIMTFKDYQLL